MSISSLLLQSAASLVAIFALYGIARALRLGGHLGGRPILKDDESVRVAAGEVQDGFAAARIAIGRDGTSALAADTDGKIIVIKRHGNRFAGRVLDQAARVREEVDAIVVDSGDTHFGPVRLSIASPGVWADAINRL